MEIKTLSSGSAGNAYVVSAGGSKILIECGIPIQAIKKGCDYSLSQMDGCLVSHAHQDHCKAAQDVLRAGVDVYASPATIDACGLTGHRVHAIYPKVQMNIGLWTVLPFEAEHDIDGALGFFIAYDEEKLLFLTDSFYCKYRFPGLTMVAIECNYSLDTLDENIATGYVDPSRRSRLLSSHMSLDQCKATLAANDLNAVKEIHLIHLSSQNADADRFRTEIRRLTGKPTFIAGVDR